MGYNLFDVLKGLERGVAEGDAQLGRARRNSMEEEGNALKNGIMEEQLKQLRKRPEIAQQEEMIAQQEQMIKDAAEEIKRIDQEIKMMGVFGNFKYKKRLNDRKKELLKFLQEMSMVPDLSERLLEEEEEEQGEILPEQALPQGVARPSSQQNHHLYTGMKGG